MLNLNPWYLYACNNIIRVPVNSMSDNDRYKILYTLAYLLGEMIAETLHKFMKFCNIRKERRDMLTMKNEYLYSRMLITNNKKNYAAIMEFKEGKPMDNKLDIKGLMINKSSTNRNASEIFKEILEQDILLTKNPDMRTILQKMDNFETNIVNSLTSGEKTYLKPASVKDIEAYADPLRITGVRAVMVWNTCYPDNQIDLPTSISILKTTLFKEKDLELIKDSEPEIYERLKEEIFNNPNSKISSKGCYVIAIPRDVNRIPEWLVPYIDVTTTVMNTFSSFMPVMESMGTKQIYVSAQESNYSNIISF